MTFSVKKRNYIWSQIHFVRPIFSPSLSPLLASIQPQFWPWTLGLFSRHPASPEDNGGGFSPIWSGLINHHSHAAHSRSGSVSSRLADPAGTSCRWARWHRRVPGAQRERGAAQWEWGLFLTGHGAAPITWAALRPLFLGTSVEWVWKWPYLGPFSYFRNRSRNTRVFTSEGSVQWTNVVQAY